MSTTVVDEEFGRRLRLIMQQFGSVADLARAVGVSDNAIYKWVSGRGHPGMASLVQLARAAGVSVEWLATGRGATVKTASEAEPTRAPLAAGGLQSAQIFTVPTVDYISFKADWLRRTLNLEPKRMALFEAAGDSMAPLLDDGDVVLADLREARFRSDGVYVLRLAGVPSIKRLQRQPNGSLLIRSDNPAYLPLTLKPGEASIIGRVVWVGGRI